MRCRVEVQRHMGEEKSFNLISPLEEWICEILRVSLMVRETTEPYQITTDTSASGAANQRNCINNSRHRQVGNTYHKTPHVDESTVSIENDPSPKPLFLTVPSETPRSCYPPTHAMQK